VLSDRLSASSAPPCGNEEWIGFNLSCVPPLHGPPCGSEARTECACVELRPAVCRHANTEHTQQLDTPTCDNSTCSASWPLLVLWPLALPCPYPPTHLQQHGACLGVASDSGPVQRRAALLVWQVALGAQHQQQAQRVCRAQRGNWEAGRVTRLAGGSHTWQQENGQRHLHMPSHEQARHVHAMRRVHAHLQSPGKRPSAEVSGRPDPEHPYLRPI